MASIFYSIGLIENWGTGFHRMVEGCSKNGNFKPEFSEKSGAFVVVFYKRDKAEGITEGITEGINHLINFIQSNPGKRLAEMTRVLDIPIKTLERWVKRMKEEGKIEFRGSKKSGGYFII